jgi:hypothetical protein
MDLVELMQKALDKTNDPDALFALDKGITEIERLRGIIDKQMVKEFADRWANHILYDQPKIPQGFPSLLDALKDKE